MSNLNLKIQSLYIISQNFFEKYTKHFESGMDYKKFNKFRLYFLNILIEVNDYIIF
jgi:hypothetical protein